MKRYIVSTGFYHEYFQPFLEDKKIKYSVSWTEEEMGNQIVTIEDDTEENIKDITMFIRFPRLIKKEAEKNDK